MKKTDMIFIMNTAALECSIAHKVELESLKILESKTKKNTYYLVDKTSYLDKSQKTKVYFKKEF